MSALHRDNLRKSFTKLVSCKSFNLHFLIKAVFLIFIFKDLRL